MESVSVNLREPWLIPLAPINLQSFELILHFNHCLINNLMTCEFELHTTQFSHHLFGLSDYQQ